MFKILCILNEYRKRSYLPFPLPSYTFLTPPHLLSFHLTSSHLCSLYLITSSLLFSSLLSGNVRERNKHLQRFNYIVAFSGSDQNWYCLLNPASYVRNQWRFVDEEKMKELPTSKADKSKSQKTQNKILSASKVRVAKRSLEETEENVIISPNTNETENISEVLVLPQEHSLIEKSSRNLPTSFFSTTSVNFRFFFILIYGI